MGTRSQIGLAASIYWCVLRELHLCYSLSVRSTGKQCTALQGGMGIPLVSLKFYTEAALALTGLYPLRLRGPARA